MRRIAGLALVVALGAAPSRAAEPTARELLDALEKQVKTVSETVGPSVACVVVCRSESLPEPPRDGKLGAFHPPAFAAANPGKPDLARRLDLSDPARVLDYGCAGGVVVDAAGLVMTTHHAVDAARKVYVHLPGGKGSYADLHAYDARSDLAVLKLLTPPADLKPIKMGEVRTADGQDGRKATVFPGKLIATVAHSYVSGLPAATPGVTVGQVSNVRRPQPTTPRGAEAPAKNSSVYLYGLLMEFTALTGKGITTGVSGAAVVNLDGELVGLTTAAAVIAPPESGPGFALPIDPGFRGIAEVLRRGEEVEYGFLGVTVQDGGGLVVSTVTTQGPAWVAGIQSGDRILAINDQPAGAFEDLLLYAGSARAGNRLRLAVESRTGLQRSVTLTLAKFKNDAPFLATVRPEPVLGLTVDWGSTLVQGRVNARDDLRAGVVVRDVAAGSPAAAHIKPYAEGGTRWLVTKLNGAPTPTPADFYRLGRGQAKLTLTVVDPNDPVGTERVITIP